VARAPVVPNVDVQAQKYNEEHVPVLQGLGIKAQKNNTEPPSPGPQQQNPLPTKSEVDSPRNRKFISSKLEYHHVGV
jgi:hypothetical protein